MSRTAIAVEQTIWDCRWSQPGMRLAGALPANQPFQDQKQYQAQHNRRGEHHHGAIARRTPKP